MAEPRMLESVKVGASNPANSGDNQQLSTLELLGLGKAKDGSNLNVKPADIGVGYRQLDQSKNSGKLHLQRAMLTVTVFLTMHIM
ncbi:MAG: hypothetical protein IPI39_27185 [Candidatus Obscuribacter sp.]|nr:hypothetical protein [Candidatus Obscuribacter sp.]